MGEERKRKRVVEERGGGSEGKRGAVEEGGGVRSCVREIFEFIISGSNSGFSC